MAEAEVVDFVGVVVTAEAEVSGEGVEEEAGEVEEEGVGSGEAEEEGSVVATEVDTRLFEAVTFIYYECSRVFCIINRPTQILATGKTAEISHHDSVLPDVFLYVLLKCLIYRDFLGLLVKPCTHNCYIAIFQDYKIKGNQDYNLSNCSCVFQPMGGRGYSSKTWPEKLSFPFHKR